MRKTHFLSGMAAALLAVVVISCSKDDDDKSTNTPNQTQNQQAEILVGLVSDQVLSSPWETVLLTEELMKTIQGPTDSKDGIIKSLQDPYEHIIIESISEHTYNGGWHMFQFQALVVNSLTHDTVDAVGIDSVQILVDGEPQYSWPWLEGPDAFKVRSHVDWEMRTGSGDKEC